MLTAYFETVPLGGKLSILVAWFIGALAGAWVANAIAGRSLAGWIVVLLVIAGGIVTMLMITHPAWMWAGEIGLPLIAGWLARTRAAPAAPAESAQSPPWSQPALSGRRQQRIAVPIAASLGARRRRRHIRE